VLFIVPIRHNEKSREKQNVFTPLDITKNLERNNVFITIRHYEKSREKQNVIIIKRIKKNYCTATAFSEINKYHSKD
jgi:lipopolysaccharide export LptBFGC system permease protein LptF